MEKIQDYVSSFSRKQINKIYEDYDSEDYDSEDYDSEDYDSEDYDSEDYVFF